MVEANSNRRHANILCSTSDSTLPCLQASRHDGEFAVAFNWCGRRANRHALRLSLGRLSNTARERHVTSSLDHCGQAILASLCDHTRADLIRAPSTCRLYSGALTAATLLIPYSAAVEGLSNYAKTSLATYKGGTRQEATVFEDTAAACCTAVFVTFFGMQPIEKKLVMDQMLQRDAAKSLGHKTGFWRTVTAPGRDIYNYVRTNGNSLLRCTLLLLA